MIGVPKKWQHQGCLLLCEEGDQHSINLTLDRRWVAWVTNTRFSGLVFLSFLLYIFFHCIIIA